MFFKRQLVVLMTKFLILFFQLDDEPFNPDYVEIDRVLDTTTTTDPVSNEV